MDTGCRAPSLSLSLSVRYEFHGVKLGGRPVECEIRNSIVTLVRGSARQIHIKVKVSKEIWTVALVEIASYPGVTSL